MAEALASWMDMDDQPGRELLLTGRSDTELIEAFHQNLRLRGIPATVETARQLLTDFAHALYRRIVGDTQALQDRRSLARHDEVLREMRKRRNPQQIGAPPSPADHFVGRTTARRQLVDAIRTSAPSIVQIHGKAGYGKSALAGRVLLDLEHEPSVDVLLFISSRDHRGLSLRRIALDVTRFGSQHVQQVWSSAWAPPDAKIAALVDAFRDTRAVVLLDDLDPVSTSTAGSPTSTWPVF